MIALPNLLATRNRRLAAFFLLYITEGIPLGFAATAVAAQLRRMGVGPAEIGAFVGSFYLPWAFKWAFGPFIDVFRSQRFGHRRAWIIGTQVMMALTLLALTPISLPQGLGLFTAILLVHNTFGAMQDVAIDALACNSLGEGERGLANGLMFAGAAVGQAIGGSGVLFLMAYTGFQGSFVLVALSLLMVTALVAWPMKESVIEGMRGGLANAGETAASPAAPQAASSAPPAGGGMRAALAEMRTFAVDSFGSFIGSRGAFVGVFVSLLPAGAMSLGLALQSNLGVEFGMTDDDLGWLNLATSIVGAASMVAGGYIADKLGRLRMLALYTLGMSLPVLYLAWRLQAQGYVMPRAVGGAPMPGHIQLLWWTSILYNVAQGLMYGTRSAVFMDVTNPRVAATQFTAYMAMQNLAIAYSATWLGAAVEAWGYPITLLADAVIGAVCVAVLFGLRTREGQVSLRQADAMAGRRARRVAAVLAVLCLAWPGIWHARASFGAAQPIVVGTLFTLVFVMSALFLLAGREVLRAQLPLAWRRLAPWIALGLLAMYARQFVGRAGLGAAGQTLVQALIYTVPVLAAACLAWLARHPWQGLSVHAPASTADSTSVSRSE